MLDRKPGLMIRLSHLILVQVVFVFAALALIVLFPSAEVSPVKENKHLEEVLNEKCPPMLDVLNGKYKQSLSSESVTSIETILTETMSNEESIVLAQVFIRTSQGQMIECSYHSDTMVEDYALMDVLSEVTEAREEQLWNHSLQGQLTPLELNNEHILYSYLFQDLQSGVSALLLIVWEHDLLVSDRSTMLYALLILFLGAILSALLIVYLIMKQFNRPYRRLLHGLEKTAKGDLYYTIEAEGEEELDKLRRAFNRMSQTLWDDHQKLEKFSHRLKDATISLKESQVLLGTVIENSPIGVVASDSDGEIIIFNRKAKELFGYSGTEAVGRELNSLFDKPVVTKAGERYSLQNESGVEVVARRQDGSHFPAYLICLPLAAGDDLPFANLYMIRDITESKRFQEMMVRLDRFYTRGRMASEIAHEINNHLSVLSGNLELLPLAMASGEQKKAACNLNRMRESIDHITRFADGLMDTDRSEVIVELCDINQMVENVVAFLKPQNRFDFMTIQTHLSTKLPLAQIDANQIQQVLVNLVDNAAEALLEKSGERNISVTTSVTEINKHRAVKIEIRDNGSGVPADKVGQLFNRRFTTKEKGQGIGLVTCRKIIDGHMGYITYTYDKGAVFAIIIPVSYSGKQTSIPQFEQPSKSIQT